MSWVEDTLVEAFLAGASYADDCLAPEPVLLGWEFDRSSGFYFHRSLSQLFSEEGGVFFDDSDKKYFYFDGASRRHEEMSEEQLALLHQCATNANLTLPGLVATADTEVAVRASCSTNLAVDLAAAWQKPWEDWVEGQDGALGFRFFATREPPVVWTVSTSSAQLFRHSSAAGYELVGRPILCIGAEEGRQDKEEILACGSTALATQEGQCFSVVELGVHPHNCIARYHPGLERWQVRSMHGIANVHLGGIAVHATSWVTVHASEGDSVELRLGGIPRILEVGQKRVETTPESGPCSQSAVMEGRFEINPELLPPPPVSKEVRMEFDNRLRRKVAHRMSTADMAAQARRESEYADRAAKRRQTRVEWDDSAAVKRLHATLADDSESDSAPQEHTQKKALAEANLNADGSFTGADNCTRAGLGFQVSATGCAEFEQSEAQKRRRITLERYQQSVG